MTLPPPVATTQGDETAMTVSAAYRATPTAAKEF